MQTPALVEKPLIMTGGPGEVAASKAGASCPAEGEEVFGEQKKRAGHVPGALRPSEAGTV